MFSGVLKRWASKGFFAVSISQPGYGDSQGPADFCGPKTQDAIVQFLKRFGTHRKIVLWGFSRGAIVAAMIAAKHAPVDGLVLIAGLYDFESALPSMPSEIVGLLQKECGLTPACFSNRSALKQLANFKAKTLILHGELDDRTPFVQARELHAQLIARGVSSELRSFPEHGHMIPIDKRNQFIDPFIESFK
jgi:dipeptidyl aminopeptidase/acylaminoacyl peptidase